MNGLKVIENNVSNKRVGETRVNNQGETMFIVDYIDAKKIYIQFKNTGELVQNSYGNFKKGNIKSHFTPSVYGVGIVGLEDIKDENDKILKSYDVWHGMLRRCYDKKYQSKYPTYISCSVCEEWHNYQNFAKWFDENYYEVDGEKMCLDKDIINKGNKVYSPNNCVFVPNNINTLFVKSNSIRGDLPIGVSFYNGKYKSQCCIFDTKKLKTKQRYLGVFDTKEKAFNIYKDIKEENIKAIANYYKKDIPKNLYDAMISYEIEICD